MLDAFLKELPWLLATWVVVTLALVIFGLLSGEFTPRQSLRVAVGFLPLTIPLAPLTWMRFDSRARDGNRISALGFGCLWAVVTMPLAVGLGLFLTRLVGGE